MALAGGWQRHKLGELELIWIDFVFIVILAGSTLYGVWTGVVWQVANVVSFLVAILVAGWFSDPVGVGLQSASDWLYAHPGVAHGLGYAIVFLAVLLVFKVIGFFMREVLRALRFGMADRIGGGALGFLAGFIACAAITTILLPAGGERGQSIAARSAVAPYLLRGMQQTRVFFSEDKVERAKSFFRALREKAEIGVDRAREAFENTAQEGEKSAVEE